MCGSFLIRQHSRLTKFFLFPIQSNDKRSALQETKDYTTRSLASVAYQINTLACQLLHMLNLQSDQLNEMESQINHISQTIAIHKEKVARREIGVLTTNKCINSQHKILVPANPERPAKYTRKPIDYSILDDIGHGVKIVPQQNLPRTKRLGSTSGIYGETTGLSGSAPTSKPPNPPLQTSTLSRHTGSSIGLGTLSRNSKEYRTPVPVVAPPQVPSNYAANYPQGHPRAQQTANSAVDYRRGSNSSSSVGYSTLPMSMNHQQLPANQLPAQMLCQQPQSNSSLMQQQQPQIGMVHPISQMNSSLNSNNSYGQQSINSVAPPVNHQMSTTPPPPPLPIHQTAEVVGLDRTSGTISPPLPSPPPAMDEQPAMFNSNDWIPKEYIEKMISIYDYNASRSDELSFKENSIIYVIKKNDDGWFEGVMEGITGLFPGNYAVTAPM